MQTRPMTPDEVFAVLAEWHRIEWNLNIGRHESATREMPLHEWCDRTLDDDSLLPSAHRLVNSAFRTDFTRSEWAGLAARANRPSLWDASEFIAPRTRVPSIQPHRILGRDCLPAGAFETIREMISAEGADTAELAPSTPLQSIAARPLARVIDKIWRLQPRIVYDLKFRHPPDGWFLALGSFLLIATLPASFVAAVRPWPWLPLPLIAFGGFLGVWHWSCVRQQRGPEAVQFRSLHTLRDLCCAIAGERVLEPAN